MKVLLVNTLYSPNFVGGAERSVQALAESLVAKEIEVFIITTNKKDLTNTVNGVKVYYLNTNNIYWEFDEEKHGGLAKLLWHGLDSYNFRISRKIKELIVEIKPDVVHTNNVSGLSVNVWGISKKLGLRVVHTLRDYYLLCPKTSMFKDGVNCTSQCLSCKLYSANKKSASQHVDAVVGISEFIRTRHREYGYFKNAKLQTVIGNDVGEFSTGNNSLNPHKITFGFIGQIVDAKGVGLLVSVFNECIESENWELIVAGVGEKFEEMTRENSNKKIKFIGKVDSKEFYSNINVLVVPSLWQEPFGRVVLEGQKAGRLVIGSNRGGIKELLSPDNLFEPTKEGLTKKVEKILTLKEFPISESREDENVAGKYLELYKKVMAN